MLDLQVLLQEKPRIPWLGPQVPAPPSHSCTQLPLRGDWAPQPRVRTCWGEASPPMGFPQSPSLKLLLPGAGTGLSGGYPGPLSRDV